MKHRKNLKSLAFAGVSAPDDQALRSILLLRGQKVMLDGDLALLYGTTTKALNQAVKRNIARFPSDFMFTLSRREKEEVVTNCDHLKHLRYSPSMPNAFTEHGTVMLASVIKSATAVQASIHVVRAFIRLRYLLSMHRDLAEKLSNLEKNYDKKFSIIFDAIRQLMVPPTPIGRRIGFLAPKASGRTRSHADRR